MSNERRSGWDRRKPKPPEPSPKPPPVPLRSSLYLDGFDGYLKPELHGRLTPKDRRKQERRIKEKSER